MGWIIAGAVVVFIMILLMTSVKVRFEYSDGLRLKINWLFITLVRIPAKTRKQKRRNKKTKKAAEAVAETQGADTKELSEKAADSSEENKQTSSDEKKTAGDEKQKSGAEKKKLGIGLGDIWEIVKLVWDSLSKPLKRLLKATRFYGFSLRIVCGGSDAAKAALNYGRISAAAGMAQAFLEANFTMKKAEYDINVDFMSEKTRAECVFTAKLTPMAAVAFLFWVLGRAVKNYLQRDKAKAAIGKLRK